MVALGMLASGCGRQIDIARIMARNISYQITHPVQPAPVRLKPFGRDNPGIQAGWVGHSTVLLSFFGTQILTDPNFSKRIKIPRRIVGVPIEPEEIRDLDVILVSHAHFDHLDIPSLKRLPRQALLVIPKGCGDLVKGLGYPKIVELEWDQEIEAQGVKIKAIHPRHWGKRSPLDEKERGYNSYIISKGGRAVLFAGDTGYSKVFGNAGKEKKFSLAFFPISAYKPDWFQANHATPEQALQMFLESGADYMIPIHWGTFMLSLESLEDPVERLRAEAKRLKMEDRVIILKQGESFTLPEKTTD